MKTRKELLALRGKCLSEIVTKIDQTIEKSSRPTLMEINWLIANIVQSQSYIEFDIVDRLDIESYVEDYLEILVTRREVKIQGYKPKSKLNIDIYNTYPQNSMRK